ncbi:putative ribonuclease H protein [Sesamum angolense]|uniref:Ribonuclease H protein n=1 Tax=Sesamum angolense TaxID=2727404 RepID=A0AAE2BLW3_9LAMI|nr:putative ribonuclease H protein [Sesamum angolense]
MPMLLSPKHGIIFKIFVEVWKPEHLRGWVKLNTDGASKGNPGLARAGDIVRDYERKVILAFSEPIGFTNNMVAEMHVVLRGFGICLEKGFSKVWLELDAIHVIHLIFRQVRGVRYIQNMLQHIQIYLQQMEVRISHIFREENQAADYFATKRWKLMKSPSLIMINFVVQSQVSLRGCSSFRLHILRFSGHNSGILQPFLAVSGLPLFDLCNTYSRPLHHLQPTCVACCLLHLSKAATFQPCQAAMARTKNKAAMAELTSGTTSGRHKNCYRRGARDSPASTAVDSPVPRKIPADGLPAKHTAQPSKVPVSAKETATPIDTAKVSQLDFHEFISELEASPFASKTAATAIHTRVSLPAENVAATAAKTSFAGLFSANQDRQRILAGDPYFVYGKPLLLKTMPDCFEFKEDDISLTPVWATRPSLPLECWHPNALGKIGSRLGIPIAMDSLTMKMERVSYARILVEVDASKKLVDHVEFILPNGVTRKQPVVYEYTPKFCSTCKRFGHLKESCQPPAAIATATVTATATAASNVNDAAAKTAEPKKAQPTEWTVVQRRQRTNLKQQPAKAEQMPDAITGRSTKQTHTAVQQPAAAAMPRLPRPAVVETESDTDSSGSSNDLDSSASTQHLVPGG